MKLSKDNKLIEHICKEMRIGFKSFTEEMLHTVDTYLQESGFQIYPENKKGLRDFKNAPINFVPTEPTYTPWQKCPVCEGEGEKMFVETSMKGSDIFVSYTSKDCHCCQGSGCIPMKTN